MARYRPVFTDIWVCDDKFQDYSVEGKLLFLYLITNDHLEESGIYKITYKTISNETDIPKEKVKKLINEEIKNNVSYDDKNSVIFVHKFLKFSGGGNPELIKKSIEKGKRLIKTTLWNKFHNYYTRDLEPLDNILEIFPSNSIPNDNSIPNEDTEILALLFKVKDYPFNKEKDLEFIKGLKTEFPDVDILEKTKQITINWLKFPLNKKSRPRVQIRRWVTNEQKWQKEGDKGKRVGESTHTPSKKEDNYAKARAVKMKELEKKYQPEIDKAMKAHASDWLDEIDNKIKEEIAGFSRKYHSEEGK